MSEAYMCSVCGDRFEVPASVRDKYPNWTPKTCMPCRDKAPAGSASSRRGGFGGRSSGPRRPASGTQELNLPVAEVLARFTEGPQSGVFTDGSCQGNPGPGGWGAVWVEGGNIVAEKHGTDPATTNNRMELTAMIAGLEMLNEDATTTIHTDSQLVVNTLTKWASGWESKGWTRRDGEPVKNLELVQRAWYLVQDRPGVKIAWIKAHDGSRWNEYADSLSTAYLRETV